MKCDVFVAGGGISGVAAAVSAARMGCDTVLVDCNGYLGGSLTAAGVGPMMTFHAGDKQVIRGFPEEMIQRLKQKGKSPGHIRDSTGYTYTVTPFDVEGMKRELDLMAEESEVKILFHTVLVKANVTDGHINTVEVSAKNGLHYELEAKVYIDATGDANLACLAGVSCDTGRQSDGKNQPMTLNMRMANVDLSRVRQAYERNPEKFPRMFLEKSTVAQIPKLSLGGFAEELHAARVDGRVSFFREDVLMFEGNNPGEVIINSTRVSGAEATDICSLSAAEAEGRKQAEELAAFLRSEIPGFENSYMAYTGPQIGIRSSRQIRGIYQLCARDLLDCRTFADVIAHSGYPIDIHAQDGENSVSERLTDGSYYSIPFRCLVNPTTHNLIAVGRCISATFEAQAAIRTSPTVGAIGQAGGLAAALCCKNKVFTASEIEIHKLQKNLIDYGAYLEV